MRRLVTVLLAFQRVAAVWVAECDNVARLSDLNGEIYAVGGANASQPCSWRICTDRRLQRIEFRVNESRFQGSDQLAFYSYRTSWRRCDDRNLPDAMIGIFSVYQPLPGAMELHGAADMFLVAAVQCWLGALLKAALWARKESPRRLAESRGHALSQR